MRRVAATGTRSRQQRPAERAGGQGAPAASERVRRQEQARFSARVPFARPALPVILDAAAELEIGTIPAWASVEAPGRRPAGLVPRPAALRARKKRKKKEKRKRTSCRCSGMVGGLADPIFPRIGTTTNSNPAAGRGARHTRSIGFRRAESRPSGGGDLWGEFSRQVGAGPRAGHSTGVGVRGRMSGSGFFGSNNLCARGSKSLERPVRIINFRNECGSAARRWGDSPRGEGPARRRQAANTTLTQRGTSVV